MVTATRALQAGVLRGVRGAHSLSVSLTQTLSRCISLTHTLSLSPSDTHPQLMRDLRVQLMRKPRQALCRGI